MAFQSVFIIFVGAFGIVSNGLTLFVFFCDPLRVFKHSSTYFIKSLTVADLLTSVVAIVWGVDIFPSKAVRQFCAWVFWTTIQASIYTLVNISGERYIAVVHPQKRRRLLTGTRITVCIITTWVLSALTSVLLALSKHRDIAHFILYLVILLAICVFSLLYVIMFCQMRRGCRRLEAQLEIEDEQKNVAENKNWIDSLQRTSSVTYRRFTIERERRLLSLVLMLIIILWSTVVPYLITSLIYYGKSLFCKECKLENELRARKFIFPTELLNFAVNPILYAFRLSHYRKSLVVLFSRCFRVKTVNITRLRGWSGMTDIELSTRHRHRQESLRLDIKTTHEKTAERLDGSMSLLPLKVTSHEI